MISKYSWFAILLMSLLVLGCDDNGDDDTFNSNSSTVFTTTVEGPGGVGGTAFITPPTGVAATVGSGVPYVFTTTVTNVSSVGGVFSATLDTSTGTTNHDGLSVSFTPLTPVAPGVFESTGTVSGGFPGDGTVTMTLTYREDELEIISTFFITVGVGGGGGGCTPTLSFAPVSPGATTVGVDLPIIATGTPPGGMYSTAGFVDTGTGGSFTAIDAATGAFTFTGSATAGSATIDVTYDASAVDATCTPVTLTYTVNVTAGAVAPVVTSVTPGAAGSTATITGTDFDPAATITLGGTAIASTFGSATSIDFTVPADASASFASGFTVDVVVINPGPVDSGVSGTLAFTLIKAPAAGEIVINEIMFNGLTPEADSEFVEFVNTTDAILNIAGYSVGESIPPLPPATEGSFTFGDEATDLVLVLPAGYLNPLPVLPATGTIELITDNEFFVIVTTAATLPTLADLGGDSAGVVSSGSFALANGGDDVVLVGNDDTTIIDAVDYSAAGFPGSSDGVSISLTDPALDNTVGANWFLSTAAFSDGAIYAPGTGTPGSTN